MKAIIYSETGAPSVLRLVERKPAEPGPGEVRVRIVVSGVNPTDWKTRKGVVSGRKLPFPDTVPNQDGAGVIDAIGSGVAGFSIGDRVWLWDDGGGGNEGTAPWLHGQGTGADERGLNSCRS